MNITTGPAILFTNIELEKLTHNIFQLSVSGAGTVPLQYQWFINNTELPNHTPALTMVLSQGLHNISVTVSNDLNGMEYSDSQSLFIYVSNNG